MFGLGPGEIVLILLVLLICVLVVLAGVRLVAGPGRRADGPTGLDGVPEDVLGLRQEVAALRAEARSALRHLAVVRYDAFEDMGGHLSWSLALLDDSGDGVVLTSIHGRSDSRSYAKNVAAWRSDQQLSPEEQDAINGAKAG